jgi:glycosyltransferase involved in cell wall biosynthesis
VKISIVVSDLSGGGAVRAYLLGQAFQQLQWDVEIVGFLFGKDLFAEPPNQLPIKAIPGQPYPQFFYCIRELLNHIQGDLICAVKPKPTSFGVTLLKKLQTHRPLLLDMDDWEMSWHGGDEWRYQASAKQFYRDLFKRDGQLRQPDHPLYVQWLERFVSWADALTIDTQFLQHRFGGIYLPNGKDTNLFNPDRYDSQLSRERYGLSQYRVLMFPGAPRPHKGVEDILAALDRLDHPDLRLVIVGGSPYDDYDNQLLKRWGRWVIKLPKFPVETMPEIISAAHIVVVPQRDTLTARAQFPLKLTDGMSMAKPILTTCVGDIPAILGDTGFLVDPNSPDQLAEKLDWILQNSEIANNRGRQARERCVQYYSIDAMAEILSKTISPLIPIH